VTRRADPHSWRERPGIERKFAKQKKYHGLRQARYCGLAEATIQVLIVCMVVNCTGTTCVRKWIAKLQAMGTSPRGGGVCRSGDGGR